MTQKTYVLELIKESLFDYIDNVIGDINWILVCQELQAQAIIAIPAYWLNEHPILDTDLQMKWSMEATRKIMRWYQVLEEQTKLMQLMHENDIEMAILKGSAVAIYYPHPELRSMGDVDFLVKPDKFKAAFELMKANGYHLDYPEDHVDYHLTMSKNGVVFELHNMPAGVPEGEVGGYLAKVFVEGLAAVELNSMDKYIVPMMPRLQNGMVLLLHIVKHLKSGLGIRQIIDWMMFVHKNLDDKVWQDEFQSVLHRCGLETLAKVVTRMCQLHLGLRREITWCTDVDDKLCDELMEYFMDQGNFGRKKNKQEETGSKILAYNSNMIQFFKFLQERGCYNWKLAQKHAFVRPFAWIYQICRYVKLSITRQNALEMLKIDATEGKRRRNLFRRLAVFDK